MQQDSLKTRIAALPLTPGVYMYKDAKGKILYVGKAKILKSRVRSYFTKSADLGPAKTKMVSLIDSIETISTDSELEALVLEANLVRKHQPPYNVLLRDDKYFLFIKITKEDTPRIFPVRKITTDGSRYFGPYSSAASVRSTLKLLRRIFPFKEEKDSPRDIIFPHPLFTTKPPRHSGLAAPRVALGRSGDPESTWAKPGSRLGGRDDIANIDNIINFLKGNRKEIVATLERGIAESSDRLEFERAALFRDQLQAIMRLEGFQKVYIPRKESFDVISIARASHQSAGNVLQIRDGKLLGKQTFLLRHTADAAEEDVLRQFIIQYYSVAQDIPKEVLIPTELQDKKTLEQWIAATLLIPQRGVRKQLMVMGETNAQALLHEQHVASQTKAAAGEALKALLKAINLEDIFIQSKVSKKPVRIETYDISNIQGILATASMIVFEDGMPTKNEYRKFKIRYGNDLIGKTLGVNEKTPSVEEMRSLQPPHQSNDFAMLEETLTRRLSKEGWKLPDLIIIDGGKGQLSAATKALKKTNSTIPIISIAKQEEIIFVPPHPLPTGRQASPLLTKERGATAEVRLAYDSPALYLIQRMRDEAHRFTITYHRSLRSREQIKSVLDEIPGIGPKTKKLLLKTFGSIKEIKNADDAALEQVIGKQKTQALRQWL